MPNTRLMTVAARQDLTSLVRDMFAIPQTASSRVTQDAVRAVVEANPHLAGLKTVPDGTPIVVPHLPDLTPSGQAAAAPPAPWTELVQEANDVLQAIRADLTQATQAAQQKAKDTQQLLRSREFRAAAANNPSLPDGSAAIASAAADAAKAAEARAKQLGSGLDDLAAALKEFVRLT